MPHPPRPQGAVQGAFFGRRKGHKLRIHQADLMTRLLPRLAVDIARAAPADLRALFSAPVTDVRLEIGFGGGEHLVAEALAHPEIGFIGCEPYVNGMAKILAQIETRDIHNIRLVAGDAAELLAWAPAGSLARIDLIHPDPWPKRRHWKRRFVNADNVNRFYRLLQPGGEFRFASDIESYVNWTLRHVLDHGGFEWTALHPDDWHQPWEEWISTRYEQKAVREGRTPAYFIFRRKA